jgi:hypothetical protein
MHRGTVEAEHRLVDPGSQLGMDFKQATQLVCITGFHGRLEQINRRLGQRLDFLLELRPVGEAIASRDHELSVAQAEILRRRWLGVQRMDTLARIACVAPIVACKRLSKLSLVVEIRIGGKRTKETLGARTWQFMGQDRPLSLCPVSTRRAERWSSCGV